MADLMYPCPTCEKLFPEIRPVTYKCINHGEYTVIESLKAQRKKIEAVVEAKKKK